ncbi:MMPL family transporter [Streptomyces sp. NPDC002671]
MSVLGRWCYRHRFVVIIAWVGLLLGLTVLSQVVKTNYDNSLTLQGTGSGSAQALLQKSAPAASGDADQIVWQVSQGSVTDPAIEQRISSMLTQVSHMPEVASVASPYVTGGEVQVAPDKRTAYATVTFTDAADNLDKSDVHRVINAAVAARQPGLAVELGGKGIAGAEETPASNASLIGIVAAAAILLIAFGSLLAMVVPIVTAVAGMGAGLLLVSPLSHMMSVNGIAPILGALIGLGVGVDYALFIVTRHRRNLEAGMEPEESTARAVNTSGRAVLFAGGTVCIALLGLLSVNLTFIDGLAVPAAITVVCTVIAAVTLLPALLGVLGMRVMSRKQRRALKEAGGALRNGDENGLAARWSRVVPRFPALLTVVGLAVALLVAAPVFDLRLGFADASNDPTSTHTYKSYKMLAKGFGAGFNGPLVIVAQAESPADKAALKKLDQTLSTMPGVAAVQTAPSAGSSIEITQVVPTTAPEDKATSNLINHLRNTVIPQYTNGTTLHVYIGGLTATMIDFATVTTDKLPWLLLTIVGFGFLLLVLAFRSLLIPAFTAVLNLLSAAASFGVLTAFFQWGWGTKLFGLGSPSPIEGYLPELVLAVLFGLSMDYQVFLVSRMAEEWQHTRDNTRSVLAGVTHTARVITAAALIMIAVFTAFIFTGQRGIAEFGVGLAAAVALDAFVLRTVLVPAVMYMCGKANWWLPKWLDRILPHLAIEPAEEEELTPAPGRVLV